MATEYSPLLRSSIDINLSQQRHLNRTMSLRAALLAFPLPSPSFPPTSPSLTRRRTTINTHPLKTYNSNYTRLTQAKALRRQQRQSIFNPEPPYSIPSTYDAIRREFPPCPPIADTMSIKSMTVEIDDSSHAPFEIFENPPSSSRIVRRLSGRATLLSSGSVANRQRLRKKLCRKTPKEVSVNILRSTGNFVGKRVSEGVKKARTTISLPTGNFFKKIARKVRGNENKRDELHKYLYDLHGSGYAENEIAESIIPIDDDSFVASENDGFASSEIAGFGQNGGAGFVSNVHCVGEDFVPAGRRQTWTNLSSVLMDEEMPTEESSVEEAVDNPGLTTIEEVFEISHCGRRAENPVSVHETLQPSPTNVSPGVQTMAAYLQSLAVALKNPHTVETSDVQSRASVDSIPSEPSESLHPLSSPTQDIFDVTRVSTTYYSGISDPIKPSTSSSTSPHPAEVTRPMSADSEILGELKQRQISLIPSKLSYSSSLRETRSSSTSSFQGRRIRPSFGKVSSRKVSDEVHRHVSSLTPTSQSLVSRFQATTSIPAIESWKWTPEDVGVMKSDEDQGRSVRERVRELDRAIDHAMSFESPVKQERRGFRFGGWN